MPSPHRISLVTAGFAVTVALTAAGPPAYAAQAQVGLGNATSFAVLAGSTVTNTGPTTISGDVGVSPQTAVVGFPPGVVSNGTIHAADAVAADAQDALTTAYNDAAGRGPAVDQTGKDLAGQKLDPGVYAASSSMALNGTLILDAKGDPNAVFVFQAGSTLILGTSSTVALAGQAQACNVFWQVGSSATISTGSTMVGSVLALTSITMETNASIQGRLLARNGAVTLDSNTIARPSCSVAPPAPSPSASASATPTATTSPTATSSPTSSDTPSSVATTGGPGGGESSGGGSSGGPGGGGDDGGSGTEIVGPVVPIGHPATGKSGVTDGQDSNLWLLGGLVCLGGAAAAAGFGSRSRSSALRR